MKLYVNDQIFEMRRKPCRRGSCEWLVQKVVKPCHENVFELRIDEESIIQKTLPPQTSAALLESRYTDLDEVADIETSRVLRKYENGKWQDRDDTKLSWSPVDCADGYVVDIFDSDSEIQRTVASNELDVSDLKSCESYEVEITPYIEDPSNTITASMGYSDFTRNPNEQDYRNDFLTIEEVTETSVVMSLKLGKVSCAHNDGKVKVKLTNKDEAGDYKEADVASNGSVTFDDLNHGTDYRVEVYDYQGQLITLVKDKRNHEFSFLPHNCFRKQSEPSLTFNQ